MNQAQQSCLDLWTKLTKNNLVNGDMPAHDELDLTHYSGAWAIRIMQGFAGWLAALFLIALLVIGGLFRNDTASILTSFGIVGCVTSYIIFRMVKKNDFFDQLGLVFNLAGQFMFAFGLYELMDSWNHHHYAGYFFSLFIFQFILVVTIPNFLSRLLSTWFGLIALLLSMNSFGVYGLSAAIVTMLFVLVWMNETQWGKYRSLLEPIGYGLAISLIQLNGELALGIDFRLFFLDAYISWISQYTAIVRYVLVSLASIWFLYNLVKQYQVNPQSKPGILIMSGGLLLLLMGYFITGISGALLLLLIGFTVQRKVLVGLGIVSLLTFISWYYYNLLITSLNKSLILIATGLVLLTCVYLFRKFKLLSDEKSVTQKSMSSEDKKIKWLVVSVMLATLSLVNISIYEKEDVLENGQLVLLKLAVAPRSFWRKSSSSMRLRFGVEYRLSDDDKKLIESNRESAGYFVVNLDDSSVGYYSHLYQGDSLEKNQVKMQYRVKQGRIYLANNVFSFQEGTAEEYKKAKYGEFRVADNGELLLNALRDESLNVLGLNRPAN